MNHEYLRILAHCGNREKYTENGLMAFEYSLAHGITGFETDLRMTADGVVVVIHDSDISGTTLGKGIVEQMTLQQLKRIKLKYSDETIPTVEEMMSLFTSLNDFIFELEMKPLYGEYTHERMDEFLNKLYFAAQTHLSHGCFIFTSVAQDVLRRMKTLHPDAKTGLITFCGLDSKTIAAALELGCYSVATTLKGTEKQFVDQAKKLGLKVNLWHAENLELWLNARVLGADASTSNHPVALLNAIREYANL